MIKTLVCQYFGENADLWLFGSRTDDKKKGGDYDFFIETSISDANAIIAGKIELIAKLHDSECFEDEKIDLIIKRRNSNFDMPIYNIAYRFTKLQDSMGEKVLPLILELAQEPIPSSATFAEKLNRLERIGAIPSADDWKKLRIARNAIAHDYPDDPELRLCAINSFLTGAIKLSALYQFVIKYSTVHFPEVAKNSTQTWRLSF